MSRKSARRPRQAMLKRHELKKKMEEELKKYTKEVDRIIVDMGDD